MEGVLQRTVKMMQLKLRHFLSSGQLGSTFVFLFNKKLILNARPHWRRNRR
jgi:hypothetical protein